MKRSKSPSLIFRTPLYRTPRSHERSSTMDSVVMSESTNNGNHPYGSSSGSASKAREATTMMTTMTSTYNDIDRMMLEMDIASSNLLNNSTVVVPATDKTMYSSNRKSLFLTPIKGNQHYNGFITDAHRRQPLARTKRRNPNPVAAQSNLKVFRKKDENLLNLVRSLKGPDLNDDVDTTDLFHEGTGFMFLSGDAYEEYRQQELRNRPEKQQASAPLADRVYSPSSRRHSRSDSVLTFVSTLEPSSHRIQLLSEIEDETVSPERKLECIEEFCTHTMSSYYERGLNEKDLQQIADVRITGIALSRIMYGRKSLQFAYQVIQLASVYVKMNAFEQALPHLSKALELVTEHLDHSKKSYNNISLFSSVDPSQLKSILKEGKKLLPTLLTSLGRCYLDIGMIPNANTCLQEAYRQHKLIHEGADTESEFEFEILLCLSQLNMKIGKSERAIKCLEHAWELKEAIVGGEQHEDIAKIYREMGTVHWKSGDNEQAITCFSKAQSIYNSLPGDVNAANASIVSCFLGVVRYSSGDLDQALCDLEISLKGVEAFFGPLHSKTLRVYRKLAELALEKAKRSMADRNVKLQSMRLGDDRDESGEEKEHDQTDLLMKKAIYLYRELLKRQLTYYNEESEQVAVTYEILGDAYTMQDEYLKASMMFKKAHDIFMGLFGGEDQRTAAAALKLEEANNVISSQEIDILYDSDDISKNGSVFE